MYTYTVYVYECKYVLMHDYQLAFTVFMCVFVSIRLRPT